MEKQDYLKGKDLKEKSEEWKERCNTVIPSYRNIRLNIRESALLVIDMQRFFLDASSHAYVPSGVYIISNVNRLISHYTRNLLPVILTRHEVKRGDDPGAMGRWWKDVLMEEDIMSQIDPRIFMPENIPLMKKQRYDAFYRTDLENILRGMGVKQVCISGVMTHLCCESTARGAFIRDFDVFMIADATASITESFHVSSLMACSHGFATVLGVEDILNETL